MRRHRCPCRSRSSTWVSRRSRSGRRGGCPLRGRVRVSSRDRSGRIRPRSTRRAARYAALPRGALTGHTADDQAETVLLNLLRGAGLDGLRGMSPTNRPLLGLRRSETRAVCVALDLEVVDDPEQRRPFDPPQPGAARAVATARRDRTARRRADRQHARRRCSPTRLRCSTISRPRSTRPTHACSPRLRRHSLDERYAVGCVARAISSTIPRTRRQSNGFWRSREGRPREPTSVVAAA